MARTKTTTRVSTGWSNRLYITQESHQNMRIGCIIQDRNVLKMKIVELKEQIRKESTKLKDAQAQLLYRHNKGLNTKQEQQIEQKRLEHEISDIDAASRRLFKLNSGMKRTLKSLRAVFPSSQTELTHKQDSLVSTTNSKEVIENLTQSLNFDLIEKAVSLLDVMKDERSLSLKECVSVSLSNIDKDTSSSNKINAEYNFFLQAESVHRQGLLKLKEERIDMKKKIREKTKKIQSLKDAHEQKNLFATPVQNDHLCF